MRGEENRQVCYIIDNKTFDIMKGHIRRLRKSGTKCDLSKFSRMAIYAFIKHLDKKEVAGENGRILDANKL